MKQRWTLNVRNFGPIDHASIEVHPYMMFVGPNNSGKSYLSTLLWGLAMRWHEMFPDEPPTSSKYRKCEEWFIRKGDRFFESANRQNIGNLSQDDIKETVEEEVIDSLIDWVNEVLRDGKGDLINQVFSDKSILADGITINSYYRTEPFSIEWDRDIYVRGLGSLCSQDGNSIKLRISQEIWKENKRFASYILIRLLIVALLLGGFSIQYRHSFTFPALELSGNWEEMFYLPASRTGFMLTYRDLAKKSMESFARRMPNSEFTHPVIELLKDLVSLREDRTSEGDKRAIAHWLENEVLHGEIKIYDQLFNDYKFKPHGSDEELSMHLSSSLVTELAPLIILLKSNIEFTSLLMEEPESHLHPATQRKVAQALVRLVNAGLPVWITTHSDIIFQQINNLIALHGVEKRQEFMAEFGYEEQDLLNPEDAAAYQFTENEEGRVSVEKLALTEHGFVVPTLFDPLQKFAKENIRLHRIVDGVEED